MPLPEMGILFRDASSSAFSSVLATTLPIYLLEVDLVNVPVPVWVQYITGTGIQRCLYRYRHFCILVQYMYGYGTLPSMGMANYRYWH
jgi:hypothetical protein